MASNLSFFALLFFLLTGLAASSTFISDEVFESHGSTGRALLQAKKSCPISFEFLNYTIITSKCKGPQYAAKLCCGAFKEFSCPYAEQLNDLTNDCASTMFSYINLYGKYPPGLFANECREGKQGLECPAYAPAADSSKMANKSKGHLLSAYSSLLLLSAGFLLLFFQLF
ncbi:GPI-anchored protein LLG1-like [Malania oleifera]|uniref:GPI-anchored protein LLG1-like n=1 Tax=Malania oleifera TaxID=397392 RepID=UPI0025ADC9E9|nr:GPI-anchored protein LLG1-like [Malania oleifera]XP_057956650.1 GPI-anchored protein LLG1-like [Malania oleifera]